MLVRAKYMKADFQNGCILLYNTEKYVRFHYSFTSGEPDICGKQYCKMMELV